MSARSTIAQWVKGLRTNEALDVPSGGILTIRPKVNDQGKVRIGNGTTNFDLEWFASNSAHAKFDVGATSLTLTGLSLVTSGSSQFKWKVSALTSNTTLNTNHYGGIITNRGAGGATVHTIPDAATALDGSWFLYLGVADQNVTFTAETADTLIAGLNDAAADSIAWSTSNEKIGAVGIFACDGTSWFGHSLQGTATIATA